MIATNIWAPLLGDRLGVPIPLMGYEHQYIVSGPLPELDRFDPSKPEDEIIYPSVRELDTYLYFRQEWNTFGIGSYHHAPRTVPADQVGKGAMRPFTPEDFEGEPWDKARALFPLLRTTDFRNYPKQMNGIFAFPIDGCGGRTEPDRRRLGWRPVPGSPTRRGGQDRGGMDDRR